MKKLISPVLFATLAALTLSAPSLHAQNAGQADAKAAATDAEADRFYGAMQERYRVMQEQMQKIRQTKDPKERQRLMDEHWQTWHQGAGAMGSWSMGPGMMHGYGMGPGMMGGYGMGPGMMGGYGMGSGMTDLSPEQQAKITKIQDETRKKHWELMGQMMEEENRLRDLYNAPQRDSAAISNAHKKISELQRRMYESSADARKRMESALTKEQKERSWRFWRHW